MKEPKDKRTKEYKKWKELQGAGDLVEKVLQTTGVDKVAKWVLGEDCGCEERKAKWNKKFPFNKVNCLVEEEYNWLKQWYDNPRKVMRPSEQKEFLAIYNRVMNRKVRPSGCGKCVANKLAELKHVYDEY